ncbi:hypothetical protein OIU76_009774 [Salix suchowensis]|nr:hypothetical protein OIU76_009774 [Salix suchowensis]
MQTDRYSLVLCAWWCLTIISSRYLSNIYRNQKKKNCYYFKNS